MTRTIEIGRAVLASSAQHLELWLTTLITISPMQQSIDIQELSPSSILTFLSSGDVWVGRGNHMHMRIEPTFRGEQLSCEQLEELTNNIIAAPVWSQLKLTPTPSTEVVQHGIVHIALNHSDNDSSIEERKRHRILNNVPAYDIQPPDSITKFQLHVVQFSMDVLETKRRLQVKRSRTSPAKSSTSTSQAEYDVDQCGETEILLHESTHSSSTPGFEKIITDPLLTVPTRGHKRKRANVQDQLGIDPSFPPYASAETEICKGSMTKLDFRSTTQSIASAEDFAVMQVMVDGAMRLSICGLNKALGGLKIKANSFGIGLADVAPALWRPGYLVALSQRTQLLPTISRSLGRIAGGKSCSIVLADKVKRLADSSPLNHESQALDDIAGSERFSSLTLDSLWRHLQISLSTGPMPSLQACVARNAQVINQVDSDEILEYMSPFHEDRSLDQLDADNDESTCSASNNIRRPSDPSIAPNVPIGLSDDQGSIQFRRRLSLAITEPPSSSV